MRHRDTFQRVQDYLINNYAAPTNLSGIVDYMKHGEGVTVKRETLANYVRLLESAKVLYKCPRFDLRSRRSLRGGEKYYLADPGIRFARNAGTRMSYGPALENALYVHLRSKGYEVSVGIIGKLECDFIVRKRERYAYVQVSMSVQDPNVEEREFRPFTKLADGYPKYLFSLDQLPMQRDGVRHLNLMEFLRTDGDLDLSQRLVGAMATTATMTMVLRGLALFFCVVGRIAGFFLLVRRSFWTNVASMQKTLPKNDLPVEIVRIILL